MGLLLSLIGLKTAGIVVSNPDTMVSLGELRTADVALVAASLAVIATLMHHKVWVGHSRRSNIFLWMFWEGMRCLHSPQKLTHLFFTLLSS